MHYYRACTATHWFLESHTYWTHRLSAPVQLMLNGNMPCNIQMEGFGINDMKTWILLFIKGSGCCWWSNDGKNVSFTHLVQTQHHLKTTKVLLLICFWSAAILSTFLGKMLYTNNE